METLLSGKKAAEYNKSYLKSMLNNSSCDPCSLHVVQVGNDEASNTYIKNKKKSCEEIGIDFHLHKLAESVNEKEVVSLVKSLNLDPKVHGILVQLPLPNHIDEEKVISYIKQEKDVDGFTKENAGMLLNGDPWMAPCTAQGIINILKYYDIDIAGKECVVVGRSNIVGKPVAMLLLQNDATVTICHSKTKNLKDVCKRADILVCAIGKPKFFNREYVKNGAVVVDVGIHRMDNGKLCGDVDFDDVKDIVSAITPVPGGVGAMTVSELMFNCYKAYMRQKTKNNDSSYVVRSVQDGL